MATGYFAPDRLQPGAPPLSNIFLFNKATLIFFLHQQRIVPKMEDRTEPKFSKECLTLYQYFLLFMLNFRIFSTPNKIRINYSYFFGSVLEQKSYFEEKAIQRCSWLLFVGEWGFIKSQMFFVCLFVCLLFRNYIARMGSICKERE